jgi:uroporphyrinogen-III synthase
LSEPPARPGILITRPEPAASQTARLLGDRGWPVFVAPMLRIACAAPLAPSRRIQAILVTSANALPALANFDRATRLFAVGDATAARALAAGFPNVLSAGRDAEALAALAGSQLQPVAGPLLLASGAGQGMQLAAELRARGFIVRRRVAYRSVPAASIPAPVLAALRSGAVGHAMFFSADTARAFARCMNGGAEMLARVEALAISPQTAQALQALPWRGIRVASLPNQDEMVALLP